MPLNIHGFPVYNISGPVSMYILTPKSTVNKSIYPELPVYILFGDQHKSIKNMCDYTARGGYKKIYDIDFLSLLSGLAQPNEKIDFYFEGGDFHNRIYERSLYASYPLNKIQEIAVECYKNKKPNKHKLSPYYQKTIDCKRIPNIRWQSGDLRHFDDDKFVKSLDNCNMFSFFLQLHCNEFVNSFQENPDDDDEDNDQDLLEQFIYNFNSAFRSFKTRYTETACITKLLNTTLEFTDIQTQLLSESGLVMRQLRHMNPEEKKEISSNIIQYCEQTKRQNDSLRDRNVERFHSEIINILGNLDKDINSFNRHSYTLKEPDRKFTEYLRANIDTLDKYNNLLVRSYSIFADVYTIFRSFKYFNVKEDKSILNIFYFGNYHITNMVYFLQKLSGLYDCKTVHEYKGVENRCIEIKDDINLNIIVDKNRHTPMYVNHAKPMSFKKSRTRNPKTSLKNSKRKSSRKSPHKCRCKSSRNCKHKCPRKSSRKCSRKCSRKSSRKISTIIFLNNKYASHN